MWDAAELKQLLNMNPELNIGVRSMLQDELLRSQKSTLAYAQHAAYRNILMGVLSDGEVTENERKFCIAHRKKKNITEEEHVAILADLGWTAAAFNGLAKHVSKHASEGGHRKTAREKRRDHTQGGGWRHV